MDETWLYHYDTDKATINEVAALQLTPPEKILSAKICWKSSRLEFFGSKRHPPH